MSIGKVNKNGTFSNGAFYSIPEVNALVKNSDSGGGSSGGSSGGTHYLTVDAETGSLGVSYKDIKSYIDNNELVLAVTEITQDSMKQKTFNYLTGLAKIEGSFYAVGFSDNMLFTSDSINDILTADTQPEPDPTENIS